MHIARRNSRHALATLAWGALFMGLSAGVTEFYFPHCLDLYRDEAYEFRRNRLVERYIRAAESSQGTSSKPASAPPAIVVALGSSRTLNAFEGRFIEERLNAALGRHACVCNMGVPGGTPYHALVILGRLLREGLKPDVVVVEVHPFFLAKMGRKIELTSEIFPLNDQDRLWLKEHDVPSPRADTSPALVRYRSMFMKSCLTLLLPRSPPSPAPIWDDWGSFLLHADIPYDRSKALNQARTEYHHPLQDFKLGTWGAHGYRMLLNECRSRGIRTVVVIMPEGPEFRAWYREGAREEIAEQAERLARESGSVFVNAWEWIDEPDFLDSHHQFVTGARNYSTGLVKTGLAPCLADPTLWARRAKMSTETTR